MPRRGRRTRVAAAAASLPRGHPAGDRRRHLARQHRRRDAIGPELRRRRRRRRPRPATTSTRKRGRARRAPPGGNEQDQRDRRQRKQRRLARAGRNRRGCRCRSRPAARGSRGRPPSRARRSRASRSRHEIATPAADRAERAAHRQGPCGGAGRELPGSALARPDLRSRSLIARRIPSPSAMLHRPATARRLAASGRLSALAKVSRRPTVRLKTSRPGVRIGVAEEIALPLELDRLVGVRSPRSPARAGSRSAPRSEFGLRSAAKLAGVRRRAA